MATAVSRHVRKIDRPDWYDPRTNDDGEKSWVVGKEDTYGQGDYGALRETRPSESAADVHPDGRRTARVPLPAHEHTTVIVVRSHRRSISWNVFNTSLVMSHNTIVRVSSDFAVKRVLYQWSPKNRHRKFAIQI